MIQLFILCREGIITIIKDVILSLFFYCDKKVEDFFANFNQISLKSLSGWGLSAS